jgi:predicted metal-dependent peptidase
MSTNIAAAAAVRMTLLYPFWTEIYYSMNVEEATPEQIAGGLETQATDGRTIWINREFFTAVPLEQQVTELVHELFHKILLHMTRRGMRDPKLWNIACDHAINTWMKKLSFTIPPDWLCDMRFEGMLAEQIYAILKKENDEMGGGGQGHQMPKGRLDIKEPALPSPEEVAKFEDDIKQLVDKAIANAKAIGKLPAGMEKGTVEAYKPAKEPWYNHLHRYMQSLSLSQYNWARINRRMMITHGVFAPMHYSEALGEVVVALDTSGSCFAAAQQSQFAMHLNAILAEAKPRRVHVVYFDAKTYPGEVIEAGELEVKTKPSGGGGTDFGPIFDWIDEEGIVPEVSIILTDLLGKFPNEEPEYPVVWANTRPRGRAPFGETIHVVD